MFVGSFNPTSITAGNQTKMESKKNQQSKTGETSDIGFRKFLLEKKNNIISDLLCYGQLPILQCEFQISHKIVKEISNTIAYEATINGSPCCSYSAFGFGKFDWVEGKGYNNIPLDIAQLFERHVPNVQSLIGVTATGEFLFTPIEGLRLENYIKKLAQEGKPFPKKFFVDLLEILIKFCKIQGRCYAGLTMDTIFVSNDGKITLAFPPRITFDENLKGEYTECQEQYSQFWSSDQRLGKYPLPTDDLFAFCAIVLYILGQMKILPKRRPFEEFAFRELSLDVYIATISGNENVLAILKSILLGDYEGKGVFEEFLEKAKTGRQNNLVFQVCQGILEYYRGIFIKLEEEISVQLPLPYVYHQTPEICLAAVQQTGHAPKEIKKPIRTNSNIDFGRITNYYGYYGSITHVGLENDDTVLRIVFKKKDCAIEASKMSPPFANLFKVIKIRYQN
jgi:hypothetical protein